MKTIGIISDTHCYWDDRYAEHFADCDEIWHAGDIGNEALINMIEAIGPQVRAVWGNADGQDLRRRFKETEVFTVEGVKVMLTHIGGYPGRYAPGIKSRLDLVQPKIFVCGLSHILKGIPGRSLGVLTINPGAAGRQGWQKVRTLIRLTLDSGNITGCQVIELADDRDNPQGRIVE